MGFNLSLEILIKLLKIYQNKTFLVDEHTGCHSEVRGISARSSTKIGFSLRSYLRRFLVPRNDKNAQINFLKSKKTMTTINLTTKIKAPKQIVFDASRNIDIHQQSASKSNEKAIAGVTSGLINLNETVTWKGKHFGFYITHKSRITTMNLYEYFADEMERGKFKSFKHEHFFEEENGFTIMKDKLQYETPFGFIGKLFDILFLKRHLTQFLLERNKILKEVSEKSPL